MKFYEDITTLTNCKQYLCEYKDENFLCVTIHNNITEQSFIFRKKGKFNDMKRFTKSTKEKYNRAFLTTLFILPTHTHEWNLFMNMKYWELLK